MRKRETDTDLPPGVRRVMKDGTVVPGKFNVRAQGKGYDIEKIVVARTGVAAAVILDRLRTEAQKPKPIEAPTLPTLGAFAKSWLDARIAAGELKTSTVKFYGLALRQHILPTLGPLRIDEIRRTDVAGWMERQVGISDSVNARFRVLRTVLRAAVDRHELARDPSSGIKARRRTEAVREKALQAHELEKLLEAFRVGAPKWYPLVLVLARTGCRFGEATALQWSDIDHDESTITIRRSQTKGHVGTPKNGKARIVAMTPDLAHVLRELRESQVRAQAPELREGWLFMTRPRDRENTEEHERRHIQPSSLRRHLDKAAEAAGITQHVSAHCLRHTANNTLRRHDPLGLVTRSAIGHSDVTMTARYSNVVLEEQTALMRRAFPAAFAGEPKGSFKGSGPDPAPQTNSAG